jgi:hypothetical protein
VTDHYFGFNPLRNADCGMRATNFVSSLFIFSSAEITNEERELKSRNPQSSLNESRKNN